MAKPKWWVCDGCHSLNDLPANKCYNCRAEKPESPRLMDDQYAEVPSQKRVGITVDLSKVGDLTRPDPVETQEGGGIIEAFSDHGAPAANATQTASPPPQPYDPYAPAPVPGTSAPRPGVPPLREPQRRGIDQLGGHRQWAEPPQALPEPQAPAPPPQAPPPAPETPVPQPPLGTAPPPPPQAPYPAPPGTAVPPPSGAVPPPPAPPPAEEPEEQR